MLEIRLLAQIECGVKKNPCHQLVYDPSTNKPWTRTIMLILL